MQLVLDLQPLTVSLWMLAPSIALMAAGGIAAGLARKVRPGYVLAGAAFVAALGMTVVAQVRIGSGIGTLVVGLVIASLGSGAIGILGATLIMKPSAPPEKAGTRRLTVRDTGRVRHRPCAALLGLIGTVVYRTSVEAPPGLSAEASAAARESMAGAARAAEQTPGPAAAALLDSARKH